MQYLLLNSLLSLYSDNFVQPQYIRSISLFLIENFLHFNVLIFFICLIVGDEALAIYWISTGREIAYVYHISVHHMNMYIDKKVK